MNECKHTGCDGPVKRRDYCNMHVIRFERGKDMDAPRRPTKHTPIKERFFGKVTKTDACWIWEGSSVRGYGQFRYKGATRYAHRVAYEMTYGPIPEGKHIDHTCWNRSCVRPEHLRAVTQAENNQNYPGAHKDSGSGVRGASWDKEKGKYEARVNLGGARHHLGYFADLEAAEKVLTAWRREHMPYSVADR